MFSQKVIASLCLCVLFMSAQPHEAVSQKAGKTSTASEIAILGTFHFGPTNDLASIKFDDINTDKRQAEILEVVDQLAEYAPDKVLLEYTYENRTKLQSDYEAYLNGKYELRVNERDLIGFRLAEKLGHDSIYAIDYKLNLPFDSIVMYCQESGRMDEFNAFVKDIQDFTAEETKQLAAMTLSAFLVQMNTDQFDALTNDLYLNGTFSFGEEGREVGIEAASAWYKRNMYMLKNIDRVTNPGDKALLIVGQAHKAVLRDYVEDRVDMRFINAGELLH